MQTANGIFEEEWLNESRVPQIHKRARPVKIAPLMLAVLVVLSLGAAPYAADTAQAPWNTQQQNTEATENAVNLVDDALQNTGTKMASTPGATALHMGAHTRQLREKSEPWVNYYAHVYGVPAGLVEAIIEQESGWNPYAVSAKGAVGLMQLMPETATRFGVRNRFRVDQNIRGGVAYLAWLSQKCNGNVRLMAAAYYGGEYQTSSRRMEHYSLKVQAYVTRVTQRYREKRMPVRHLRYSSSG